MEVIRVLFTIVLCAFLSCQNAKHQYSVAQGDSIVMSNIDDEINMSEDIWKRDSCGCLKQRTAQMADSIITKNHLVGKDTLAFIEHMGQYNKKQKTQDGFALIYYIKSICINNEIDENADKSWIMFDFNLDGKLKRIPEAIAIE